MHNGSDKDHKKDDPKSAEGSGHTGSGLISKGGSGSSVGSGSSDGSFEGLPTSTSTTAITKVKEFRDSALNAINDYRALHHAPPLTFDPELTEGAQSYADHLASLNKLEHSEAAIEGEFGENLAMLPGSSPGVAAANLWYAEVKDYDFEKCEFSPTTGHFTALVWKCSTTIGIGLAYRGKYMYVVARFNPPGNMEDEYKENVLPK